MNWNLILYVAVGVVLSGLLLWSLREEPPTPEATSEILETLGGERHYWRLPQILQSLQPEDIEFLKGPGRERLCARVRSERKKIALRYLRLLHEDFDLLLRASALVAKMSPELAPMKEWERLQLSTRFALNCYALNVRLRLGLPVRKGFGQLSEMASGVAVRIEAATSRIGEHAALAGSLRRY